MALIRCPECGREVSDLAAACVHCGYPLRAADLPARYAIILADPGPDPGKTAALLHDRLTLTQEEAQSLTMETPAVAVQGLTFRQAWDLSDTLRHTCTCKVVRDKSVWTPEAVRNAAPVDLNQEQSRSWAERAAAPMTFGKTVGAILCALAFWTVAGFLLASLLHAF